MTVLVLDTPELLAKAAVASGFMSAMASAPDHRPHRLKFHFGFNRHAPGTEDLAMIRQHAAYLRQYPGLKVRVHGHSDNFGGEDYNRFLSRLRAHSVAKLLMQEGVAENQILLAHWGSTRPLARPEDHAANRRVELEYLSQDMAQAL
ncbi:peptidoglycan-associated lipoprotein (19 kDa surface antigen) (PPL) [Marinobacter santoriniensis NKSG1]|uniref:Peptidoglycan-associated lipoprotein (19 kDa surface antigen) (PPL) n=1 Tax=Marinobacter santoriniensis NKSG1 TaxID=1288826 RepID=M7D2R0_9GAMM|nr:OmpA family protein [Marinobacter santoriniensis]EMP55033.1 peptidoglycan-associated lipoprotein (19 kDa surface antigen) (PPL) [Marinobacter santoriniensis NKSG1]